MTTATAPDTPAAPITLADQVMKVLRASDTPLTTTQVGKLLPPAKRGKDDIANQLRALTEQKLLFHCGKSGKQDRYWIHDEAEHLRGRIHTKVMEFLDAGPRTEKDIVMAVKLAVAGLKDKAIKDEVAALQQQKRLFPQPGRPVKIGLTAPDPLATLVLPATVMNGLRKAYENAEKAGASTEQFWSRIRELVFPQLSKPTPVGLEARQAAAIPTPISEKVTAHPLVTPGPEMNGELRELLLKAVGESGPGVPMPIDELRRQMPTEYRDKGKFDPAIWKLVEEDKLYVVPHNYPAGLSDAERADLLTDPHGEYYAYVAQHG